MRDKIIMKSKTNVYDLLYCESMNSYAIFVKVINSFGYCSHKQQISKWYITKNYIINKFKKEYINL